MGRRWRIRVDRPSAPQRRSRCTGHSASVGAGLVPAQQPRRQDKLGGHKGRPTACAPGLAARFLFAPEFCQVLHERPPQKEGRRSAGRRIGMVRATRSDVTARTCCGRGRAPRTVPLRTPPACGRARLSALRCGSRRRANHARLGPSRASRDEDARELPSHLGIALKPSTWHAGRHAGGDDARTARERLARPPAGTALAPPSGSHPESTLRGTSGGAFTLHV